MTASAPFFSIIVVNFNNGHLIAEALTSVIDQTFPDFEVIVSDNCSTDDSWDVIKSFSDRRIKTFRQTSNLGMYRNLNSAVSEARGDYLKFLNSDDVLHPQCLEYLHRLIEDHAHAGSPHPIHIVHDLLRASESNSKWKSTKLMSIDANESVDFLAGGLPDVCLQRKRFIAVGSFGHPNNKKDFSRDVLAFGLAAIGLPKTKVRIPLALERIHANQSRHSMIPTKRYQLEEMLFVYDQAGRLGRLEGISEMKRSLFRHFLSSVKYIFVYRSFGYLFFVVKFGLAHPRILFAPTI